MDRLLTEKHLIAVIMKAEEHHVDDYVMAHVSRWYRVAVECTA